MTVEFTRLEPAEGETEREWVVRLIKEEVRDAGFTDFRSMVYAWHYDLDWSVNTRLMRVNMLLGGLEYPEIPDCCPGLDHEHDDRDPLLPGDPGQAPNWRGNDDHP